MCLQPEQLSCCNCCHLFSLQLAHIFFLMLFFNDSQYFFSNFFVSIFLQMLYVDNLQHGLNTNPFSLPRCAFLDTSTIDSIANMDRRRDVSSETVELGKLMVRTHTLLAHIPLLFLFFFQLSFATALKAKLLFVYIHHCNLLPIHSPVG